MTVETFPATFEIDRDIVLAIAWCRVRVPKERPHDESAYYRAENLGLLAHDPIWRATPQGEGVLIALGLLERTWVQERTNLVVMWAREPRADAPAQFVRAWTAGYVEHFDESWRREREEAKEWWRSWGEIESWLFFETHEELPRP